MTTSLPSYTNYFRRPRISGRACSPPTIACYEQRFNPYDDDDDYSDDGSEDNVSCSEDDEDYVGQGAPREESDSDNEEGDHPIDNDASQDADSMDIDEGEDSDVARKVAAHKKDVKGKQRAIEPEPESPKKQHRQKKPRQPVFTLRPILTIQRSQGFVWNQVSNMCLLKRKISFWLAYFT